MAPKGSEVSRFGIIAAPLLLAALALQGCQAGGGGDSPVEDLADVATSVKFDSQTFGVPASPRVTTDKSVRKGGGRSHVGKPYKVRGRWYYPKDEPGYSATGTASWYGPNFHGRLTANGETYDMHGLSAAHKTFPLPSYAMVTNTENGNHVMVRVNDRGPFAHGREIDVSSEVADLLDFKGAGTATVKVDYIGRAPVEGDDTKMLMASYKTGQPLSADGVMVASADQATGLPGVHRNGVAESVASRSSAVSSYAASGSTNGAARALETMTALDRGREQITLGLVDRSLIERVKAVALGKGRLVEEDIADLDGVSLRLDVNPSADTDGLLRRFWQVGAVDAFVVRD